MDDHAPEHAGDHTGEHPGEHHDAGFLAPVTLSDEVERLYAADRDDVGYVMNLTRVWAHQPATVDGLFDLLTQCVHAGRLTFRQRAVLVSAAASTLGDSYCALAWGSRLAGEAGDDVAAAVIRGTDEPLDETDRALARWARQVVRDPNGISDVDVQELRNAGFDDDQVFAITAFVALRLAFSTVNDALGARPDRQLGDAASPAVRDAVRFGRPLGSSTALDD